MGADRRGDQIQGLDADTLTSVCCPAFDYDIMLWGWGSDPDPAFLLGVALCSEIDSGFSETGYCNPDVRRALRRSRRSSSTTMRASTMIHQMQQILIDDVPYIIPYYPQEIEAWRTDTFTGWLPMTRRWASRIRPRSASSDRRNRPVARRASW